MGSDCSGASRGRFRGRVKECRRGSVHHLENRQRRQFSLAACGKRVGHELNSGEFGNRLPTGSQCRWDHRADHQGDRGVRVDNVGAGRIKLLSQSRGRRNGSGTENRRSSCCRWTSQHVGSHCSGANSGRFRGRLKNAAADQYTVWTTDSSGNFLSLLAANVSGTSSIIGGSQRHLPPEFLKRCGWHFRKSTGGLAISAK